MSTLYRGEWELFDLPVHVRSYESLARLRLRHRDATRIRWAIESEAGKIRGPNIPDVIDAGIEDPTNPFLVMRLPAGDTLSNVLERESRLPAARVASIVSGVATGLQTCREAGAIHRGPTVDRVWLGDEGEVLLQGVGDVLYRDDTISMATPPHIELLWHIPPESFTQSMRPVSSASSSTMRTRSRDQRGSLQGRTLEDDPRAEVYALGCLAYHALNGHHPFFTSIDDATEGIQATISDAPLELRDHPPHTDIWRVVSQALARDPAERFATPLAFAEAFTEAAGVRSAQPHKAAPTPLEDLQEGASEFDFPQTGLSADDVPTLAREPDAFQLWAWRFTALVLAGVVAFLLVADRFDPQTLLITSDPPGIEIGEEFGHVRQSLGTTPVVLFDRDVTAPLRVFAIGPEGEHGATATYDINRFQDLGHCRATELSLAYPEDAPAEAVAPIPEPAAPEAAPSPAIPAPHPVAE